MLAPDPLLHRLTLQFRDPALEARFRAAEGSRSLRTMRYATLASMVLLLVLGTLLDEFTSSALRGGVVMKQAAFSGSVLLLAILGVSYTTLAQRHPQWSVVLISVLTGTGIGLGSNELPPEFVTHRGFMFLVLHLIIVYTLVRLRFGPAVVAGTLSVAGYLVMLTASGVASDETLARHFFWLFLANGWSMAICYQLDMAARREFAARLDLAREQARSESLLLNVLPAAIAERLKDSHQPIAELRENVTVVFADIVGFTPLAARKPPAELVALLDRVFTGFDTLARQHGLEKIKTIGDAYMAAAGLPHEQPDHALRAARMAVAMVDTVRQVATETGEPLSVRVGLHTGPVVAGVIGTSKFSYDLWGDTVNMASRMESHGVAGQVHCSATTAAGLSGEFALQSRGTMEVKGKGSMETFLVVPR